MPLKEHPIQLKEGCNLNPLYFVYKDEHQKFLKVTYLYLLQGVLQFGIQLAGEKERVLISLARTTTEPVKYKRDKNRLQSIVHHRLPLSSVAKQHNKPPSALYSNVLKGK